MYGHISCFQEVLTRPHFPIVEKVILIFQNLKEYLFDPYLHNRGQNVYQVVEKWIQWISPINGKFKLNFDGFKVTSKCASGQVVRNSNGIIKMAACRHVG